MSKLLDWLLGSLVDWFRGKFSNSGFANAEAVAKQAVDEITKARRKGETRKIYIRIPLPDSLSKNECMDIVKDVDAMISDELTDMGYATIDQRFRVGYFNPKVAIINKRPPYTIWL